MAERRDSVLVEREPSNHAQQFGEISAQAADLLPSLTGLMRRAQMYRRLLASADAALAVTAVLFAAWLLGQNIRWPVIAAPTLLIVLAKIQGLYDRDEIVIRKSTIAEWRELLEATTGPPPWQICGPMTTPMSEMAKLDYLYISNWSIWQDIDILVKTVHRIFDRGGH